MRNICLVISIDNILKQIVFISMPKDVNLTLRFADSCKIKLLFYIFNKRKLKEL